MVKYVKSEIVIKDIDNIIEILKKPPVQEIDKKLIQTFELWKLRFLGVSEDVVEVKHGKWEYNPDGMGWGLGAWECSLCKVKNDNLGGSENINPYMFAGSKFCPHCGAKMDGKR